MVGISGSSQYLNSATLANNKGFSAQGVSLLSEVSLNLLDVARSAGGIKGIGLSPNARALNQDFLKSSQSNFNVVFSLGVAETNSIEAAQTQIRALRSSASTSVLDRNFVTPERVGESINTTVANERAARARSFDDGGIVNSEVGRLLDTGA